MKNPFHIIKYKTIKWLEYLGAIFYLLLGPIFLFIIGFPNNLDKVFIFFLIFMIAIIPFLGKKLTRMGVAQWIWGCFLIPFISIILWLFIGYVIVVAAGVFGKGVAVENLIRNINIYKGEQIREAPFLYNEKWKVKPSSKLDYIDVSTDGTIQKGDQLRFYVSVGSDGKCNSVEHLFTFYTMTKHPDILHIQGKKISFESMGKLRVSDIKVVYSTEHLMLPGHMVLISSGLYDLDKHIDFLRKHKNHDVKLKYIYSDWEKKEGWEASEYFDILENSWSLNGADVALNKAKQICLEIEETVFLIKNMKK